MESDFLGPLRELIGILRDGGAYAGWALFILLWLFERRYVRKLTAELRELAVAQVENNVETKTTLKSIREALHGTEYELNEMRAENLQVQTTMLEIKGRVTHRKKED